MYRVDLYTDGACKGNPGPGGYGVLLRYGTHQKELSGGFARTTNNRMELAACIEGLKALKFRCAVTLHSDSQYVLNGLSKGWAKRWRSNNWHRHTGDLAENADLWETLLDLTARHKMEYDWVRGHNGHPENERCDELARVAAAASDLPPDPGFTS